MHIVTGCARRPPDWVETGYSMPFLPSVQFELDGELSAFVDHIAAQHFSLVHGDHGKSPAMLCRLLRIEIIINSGCPATPKNWLGRQKTWKRAA